MGTDTIFKMYHGKHDLSASVCRLLRGIYLGCCECKDLLDHLFSVIGNERTVAK